MYACCMHSFIHIEHLYSASSRKLLRSAPNASTVKRNSACIYFYVRLYRYIFFMHACMYFLCMPVCIFYAFLYVFLCIPVCIWYTYLYVFCMQVFICLCVILFIVYFFSRS